MVDPGASSEEIRKEVFESFRKKIEESDVDGDVAESILGNVLDENPPYEFSSQFIEDRS